ncbi:radical SAM protein [Campylobacter fetus]|uniref:radical SAM protein n=1 Tax=Campylobacter fetus TaxID=196 RepID=UPI00050929F7|nr:radical SAM protein [Campylobacter fetus]WKW17194.1 radical SAM protein [Campylobacter fetus subsp. fetus]AIR79461.1 radical SAM superfamily enzyme, MoaA/NifB/PqqE/SkfB family [Campylobacter fetus subsp. fetus 04/554]EAJ5693534.1 radical SAM protein [Campylobacter fetus]EAJ5704632.1 radical SAM protein [Campylobacter fetus]EAJ9256358.1 radical SAM protein [Campylobacter fetus]
MGLLYTKYKMFHYPKKIDSLNTDEILPPLQVRIKPTNACNHDCWYCAYKASNLQLGKDMIVKDYIPKDKMFEIIDDLDSMGVKSITFSGGGEPLSYRYMTETLEKLSKTNIKFASLTNGSKLNGDIANLFSKFGTWLRVSIDGFDDESYAKYRNVKVGEFSKVIKNMSEFSKLGGECLLGVSFIIDDKNYSHIYDVLHLFKDIGVRSVKLSPCIVSNDAAKNNEYHSKIFDNVQKEIYKSMNLTDGNFEIYNSYHLLDTKFKKDYDWCPMLQILMVIGADQNVYACQDKAYNLDSGLLFSIKNRSFKEAWSADKSSFYKIKPCEVCNHHCVSNEKNKILLEYLGADKEHLGFV